MVRVKDGIGDGFRNRVWVKVMIRGGLGGIHFSLSVLRLRLWPYWLLCPGIENTSARDRIVLVNFASILSCAISRSPSVPLSLRLNCCRYTLHYAFLISGSCPSPKSAAGTLSLPTNMLGDLYRTLYEEIVTCKFVFFSMNQNLR